MVVVVEIVVWCGGGGGGWGWVRTGGGSESMGVGRKFVNWGGGRLLRRRMPPNPLRRRRPHSPLSPLTVPAATGLAPASRRVRRTLMSPSNDVQKKTVWPA